MAKRMIVKRRWSAMTLLAVGAAMALVGIYIIFRGHAAVTCDKVASRTGSDSNLGTEASPYKTAQKVVDNLSAGQTGCLHAGVYTELANGGYVLRPLRGGTSASNKITLRSVPNDPSGRATLQGPIEFQLNTNYFTLSDMNIDGSTYASNTIEVYSDHLSLLRNDITNKHLGGSCLYLGSDGSYPQTGPATNIVVKDNIFHGCGNPSAGSQYHSIYAHTVRNTDSSITSNVQENVFYDPTGFQIQFWTDSQGMVVDHNIFDGGSVEGGIIFGGGDGYVSNNNRVTNNVVTNANSTGVSGCWAGSGSSVCNAGPYGVGNVANDNCFYNNRGGDIGSQVGFSAANNLTATNPLYTNAATRDYTVSASSPCLAKTGYDIAKAVNDAIAAAGSTPTDTQAPSVPGTITAGTTTSSSISLSWVTSTDNVGVTGYKIYRNGSQVGTSTTTSYTDSGLTASTSYSYTISAYDAAGNNSTQNTAKAISTATAASAPTTPTGLAATPGDAKVSLRWNANPSQDNVTQYNVYRTDTSVTNPWGYVAAGVTTFTNADQVVNGTQYCYTIDAQNANGKSAQTVPVCATPHAPTCTPATNLGNINCDSKVDIYDLSILLSNYNKVPSQTSYPQADLNSNNLIDIYDLSILLTNFGT